MKRKSKTRRITVTVTVEVDIPERMIPLMLVGFPALLDDLRGEEHEGRQIGAIWGMVYDCQQPIAEYQYLRSQGGADHDVREVRIGYGDTP